MPDWHSIIEESIKKAIRNGQIDDLPGAGKPLNLDSNPHTPAEMRMAHKLLKDNGYAPEWIMQGQYLDDKRAQLLKNIERGARAYKGALGDAGRVADSRQAAMRRQRADSAWQLAQEAFDEAARQLNRAILTYNLKLPPGIDHKPNFNVQDAVERLLSGQNPART